jgi:hypothetical protein
MLSRNGVWSKQCISFGHQGVEHFIWTVPFGNSPRLDILVCQFDAAFPAATRGDFNAFHGAEELPQHWNQAFISHIQGKLCHGLLSFCFSMCKDTQYLLSFSRKKAKKALSQTLLP